MVGALDEGMTKICEEHGIPTLSIEANSIKNRGAANLRFDYSAYKRMAAMKVQFYSNILRLGFNVWACDADTAWMAHPAPSARVAPCGGGRDVTSVGVSRHPSSTNTPCSTLTSSPPPTA